MIAATFPNLDLILLAIFVLLLMAIALAVNLWRIHREERARHRKHFPDHAAANCSLLNAQRRGVSRGRPTEWADALDESQAAGDPHVPDEARVGLHSHRLAGKN